MSSLLRHMRIDHRLINVPADGDCFYHAFSLAFGLTFQPKTLREMVRRYMSEEEHELAVALDRTDFQHQWADQLDIHALMRAFPHWGVVIVDDDYMSICLVHGTSEVKNVREWRALLRCDEHYQWVRLVNRPVSHLVRIVGARSCAQPLSTSNDWIWHLVVALGVFLSMWNIVTASRDEQPSR